MSLRLPEASTPPGVPLLPKLRGYFAEFLGKGSPAPLGLLSQPTCVGFRNGHHMTQSANEAFLGSVNSAPLHLNGAPLHHSDSRRGFACALLRPRGLEGLATCPRSLSSCVTPLASPCDGTGLLTRFPSATPLGFTLGYRLTLGGRPFPRYPWACGERDSHSLLVTRACILSCASSSSALAPPSPYSASLPYRQLYADP